MRRPWGSGASDSDAKTARYFEAIEKAATRAADFTRQLLAYAGKGKHVVTEVDMGVLLDEVTQLFSVSMPHHVTLHHDLADRLPFVKGDASQLFQIILNLITNASEAFVGGAEGGVTIRTKSEMVEESVMQSHFWPLPMVPGYYVTLEVADDGIGMTQEVMEKIFDPFFTTKFTGRGLGLSAVIGILGAHGGGLRLRSVLGQGSSFKIYLPAMQGVRSLQTGFFMTTWRGQGLLLLVDDERAVRGMARELAERLGFFVVEAQDGVEAMEIFHLRHKEITWVLLDLCMPQVSGRDVFIQMQKVDNSVPVVMSSGYDLEALDVPIEGVAGFLHKPYRVAEVQALLRRVLAERSVVKV